MSRCDKTGCKQKAMWNPGFKMWSSLMPLPERNESNCLTSFLNLGVCDQHKNSMKLEDILTDEGWQSICEAMSLMQKEQPDRKTVKLIYPSISQGRHKAGEV